jgi:hypothetical protein
MTTNCLILNIDVPRQVSVAHKSHNGTSLGSSDLISRWRYVSLPGHSDVMKRRIARCMNGNPSGVGAKLPSPPIVVRRRERTSASCRVTNF